MTDFNANFNYSETERALVVQLAQCAREAPMPDAELLMNLLLYIRRQDISHVLYMNHLYKQVLNTHGSILEFGVRWGRSLAMWLHLRGTHEGYNHNRKIVGFDTFEGFPSVSEQDAGATPGGFSVVENWDTHLDNVLKAHELNSPIHHMKKFELVKGDILETHPTYLGQHPETLISPCHLDLDIYTPTKFVLDTIPEYMNAGGIVAFDELNCEKWPGETQAFRESIYRHYKVRRTKYSPTQSYVVVG